MKLHIVAVSACAALATYIQDANATCIFGSGGDSEVVGQIDDIVFKPGVEKQIVLNFKYVTGTWTGNTAHCGLEARSNLPGVSLNSTYGGSYVSQGSWAGVTASQGVSATPRDAALKIVYDGTGTNGSHGVIEIAQVYGDVLPTYRIIYRVNVYIDDTPSPTWFNVTASSQTAALIIDNEYINGDSSTGRLFVSQNYNPGGVGGAANNRPIAVEYDSSISKWKIRNDNGQNIPSGVSFSVRIAQGTTHTQPTALAALTIDDPSANSNPNAAILVTLTGTNSNPKAVSVKYNNTNGRWQIRNSDGTNIDAQRKFNVMVFGYTENIYGNGICGVPVGCDWHGYDRDPNSNGVGIDMDDSGNVRTSGERRRMRFWWQDGNPDAPVIITANQNPYDRATVYAETKYVGVKFTTSSLPTTLPEANIFHQDGTALSVNSAFNVWGPNQP